MLVLDDRVGAIELYPYFKPYGMSVEVCRIESADAMWVGSGPDGDATIGVERKRITDLVACIRDQRLSGFQLPLLLESYDYVYLLIEGLYRPGNGGILEHYVNNYVNSGWVPLYTGSKGMMYSEMDSFLDSIELRAVTRAGEPVRVKRAGTMQESAAIIANCYRNWTSKEWSKHKAHFGIYAPEPATRGKKAAMGSRARANLAVRMMAQIDGLRERAFEAGKYFKVPRDFFDASEKKWKQVDGIGAKMAKQIRKDLGHGS